MAAISLLISLSIGVFTLGSIDPADSLLVEKYAFGSFKRATRILIGAQQWVYILDREDHTILLYKSANSLPVSIGGFGWGTTSFDTPTGLASDGINILVSDYGNHRIVRFDRNLNFISSLSTRDAESTPARFGYPGGIDISKQGDLFVLDGENIRVLRFSLHGRYLGSFGESETSAKKLVRPIKIAVSRKDRVYVLEPHRVVEFDYFGNYLRSLGEGMLREARGLTVNDEGVIIVEPSTIYLLDPDGRLKRKFPKGFLVSSEPMGDFEDAAMVGSDLYLLTGTKVHVFELSRELEVAR